MSKQSILAAAKRMHILIDDNTSIGLGYHIDKHPFKYIDLVYDREEKRFTVVTKEIDIFEMPKLYLSEVSLASRICFTLNNNLR